jgi:cyclophilin family peptidyl-prolyl cis-trans isomerase
MKYFLAICLSATLLFGCSKEDTKTTNTNNGIDTTTKEKIIEIKTSFGSMYMWLYKETPLHRANFLALADTNFFDNTTFHRCVTNFVIQGGDPNSKDADPTNDGSGGPGFTIPAEIDSSNKKLLHTYGAIGAARLGDAQNPTKASSGSQFYIVLPTAGTAFLNGNYTVFGRIIKGMDVAAVIVKQPKNANNNRPNTDIKMDVNVLTKTLQQLKDEYNFVP